MLGVVLAGGGVSGAAHVGVLRALVERGVKIGAVAGTSSGAIVGGLFATGHDPWDPRFLDTFSRKTSVDIDIRGLLRKLVHRRTYLGGFVKGDRMLTTLRNLYGDRKLGQLPLPLAVVSTDLRSCRPVVFTSRPLAEDCGAHIVEDAALAVAVRASAGIPLFYQPLRYGAFLLVDGGVVNNCPIRIGRALGATHVVAVDTITPFTTMDGVDTVTATGIASRIVNMNLAAHVEQQRAEADFILHPHVGFVGALEWKAIGRCIDSGYQAVSDAWPQLESIALAAGALTT